MRHGIPYPPQARAKWQQQYIDDVKPVSVIMPDGNKITAPAWAVKRYNNIATALGYPLYEVYRKEVVSSEPSTPEPTDGIAGAELKV